MAVITISRQYGSGGDEIADRLCLLLGYRHFDKRNIARAAADAGLSAQEIASYSNYSEENFKVKKFLDRLLRRGASDVKGKGCEEDAVGVLLSEEKLFNEASAVALVQEAIKAACAADNIIIVGRGGQTILKDRKNVLHLRIEAPLESRIQRVKTNLKGQRHPDVAEHEIRRDAQELIAKSDAASADYVRLFYSIDWADTSLYHAVLNTGKMNLDQTAQIIREMVRCLYV